MANQQTLAGNWNEIKGKLRKTWGQLTENDLQQFNGNVEELVGVIQRKSGETRQVIEERLNGLLEQGKSWTDKATAAASQYAQRAGESARSAYGAVGEQARSGYGNADSMVRHHPGSSVAAAFGIGLLVGLVVGVSSRS